MDYRLARLNMVESQLRPVGVTNRPLLDAFQEIPRERFVPAAQRSLAYIDGDLTLRGTDAVPRRFLLAPRTLALLIQLADIGPEDAVLDIGCASGYSAAIMARLAQAVVGLECDAKLAEEAAETLHELDADNAVVVTGALKEGYPRAGSYDVILLNGSAPDIPRRLFDQLKDGGRLVAVIAPPATLGRAHRFLRSGEHVGDAPDFDAGAYPLPGFEPSRAFAF